ncbi:MAG: response regulator [Phycisphaerales bacterium]|nr:response regulator [Phycisphaerales bacterium]
MTNKQQIIIADASATARKLLRAEFDPERFEVTEVDNGKEAIRIARELNPAIVTLSMVLPGCDGIEACKAITSQNRSAKTTVVMNTSSNSREDRMRAFEAGAVRFLSKGFKKGEMGRYANEIIRTRRRLAGSRFLVVDDNAFIRVSIARLLESEGATVHLAKDGLDGLSLLDRHEVDVILTDYDMPIMDGISFVKSLRKQRDHEATPVLFISGSGIRDLTVRALDAGANDFIHKPFEATELLARMRSFARIAQLTQALKNEARTDELTGLLVRREILARLDELCALSDRYETPLSCIMLDIDHFKSVNDDYSHAAGDAVLKSVAGTILDSLRKTDYVGRLGGEEFVVLCPNTPLSNAVVCAEKLRQVVEKKVTRFESHELAVTISLGVATYGGATTCPNDLLNAADIPLYNAKRSGRNRVCAFSPEPVLAGSVA